MNACWKKTRHCSSSGTFTTTISAGQHCAEDQAASNPEKLPDTYFEEGKVLITALQENEQLPSDHYFTLPRRVNQKYRASGNQNAFTGCRDEYGQDTLYSTC
jgi:hypothetical protein